jgi:hypothetical protein
VGKMSKGAIGIIAFIVILGLILLVEYFVVSYLVRFEYVVGRFMSEVPVLSEADKVETYVRSFQGAVELSLLQGLYETKDQSQVLWYDYGSNIPDLNTIEGIIIQKTEANVKQYLSEYGVFAWNNAKEDMELPSSSKISGGNIDKWENGLVLIKFSSIMFTGRKGDLTINRIFKPSGRVRTHFKTVWDLTNSSISNDEIGTQIRNKVNSDINTVDKCNDVNDVKNKMNTVVEDYKTLFNSNNAGKNVQINLVIDSYDISPVYIGGSFDHCQVTITVKVKMEDQKYKYPVYDGSGVIEDYLGLIYRIRTGN